MVSRFGHGRNIITHLKKVLLFKELDFNASKVGDLLIREISRGV